MTFVFHCSPTEPTDHVSDLQRKLATLRHRKKFFHKKTPYYQGEINGLYDPATRTAVAHFQHAHPDSDGQLPDPEGDCGFATWQAINDEAGSYFAETWQFEVDAIRSRQVPEHVRPANREQLCAAVHEAKLAGLAFSGGGIRSATFNLGILQALAELNMLRDFDYLSTVSGGGYIGAWFSKWLHHLGGNIDAMEKKLTPGTILKPVDQEAGEISFLRKYSNYMTPKTGLLSADTWSLLATYLRNAMLNLTILVALLAACMIAPRMLVWLAAHPLFHRAADISTPLPAELGTDWSYVAVLAALFSVFWIAFSITAKPKMHRAKSILGQSQRSVLAFVVAPLLLAAFTGSYALWTGRAAIHTAWHALIGGQAGGESLLWWFVWPGLIYFAVWGCGWAIATAYNRFRPALPAEKIGAAQPASPGAPAAPAGGDASLAPARTWRTSKASLLREGIGHLLCAVLAFATGTLLVIVGVAQLQDWYPVNATKLADGMVQVVAFGLPALLSVFGITMVLSIGLIGRMYADRSREWWSRQGAWTSIMVIGWLAMVAVSLYAPAAIGYAIVQFPTWFSALSLGWVGTTLAGLVLGKSSADGKQGARPYLNIIAAVAPFVFCIGAVCLISALLHTLLHDPVAYTGAPEKLTIFDAVGLYNQQTLNTSGTTLGYTCAALLAAGLILAWRVDINKFSLHMMYRNRLVRAYLGASNVKRAPHPFSGFDDNDDLRMDELLRTPEGLLQRPYHLVNTTLNLVNGDELAWQTRKAAGFAFSPAFCGFELPSVPEPGKYAERRDLCRGAYRRTAGYRPATGSLFDEEGGIKLGMTMAVSGAAASPNMGYHSSPALSFMMTLFNVRLGRWFANPRKGPQAPSPKLGLMHLLSELFGLTDANSSYVYLSDGGHFENLGIYELVRRRCRLIVVVDASADGTLSFDDLGNAIRKCGTDLHVEIDIGVGEIELQRESQFSKSHCVKGRIRYDKTDRHGKEGTLLYIKPSLLGTESADLLNYRKTNGTFPHQSTADQWFDETQFESYRSLGYSIGMQALRQAAEAAQLPTKPGHDIEKLCKSLTDSWGAWGNQRKSRDRRVSPVVHLHADVERRREDRRSA